jgi:multisubunit Na+/H+ antiporter MnhG subunit
MQDLFTLMDNNDKMMITGVLLFLFGGLSVASGTIGVSLGFITALAGLLMYTGAAMALSREVKRLEFESL